MITPLNLPDVEYVALNMRACDAVEIYNVRLDDNPITLAAETVAVTDYYGIGRVFHHRGRPAVVMGAIERHPGVWAAYAFGTDEFLRVIGPVTRWARCGLRDYLIYQKAHRLEVFTRHDHYQAHRWLERIGAEPESMMTRYGRDRSDYLCYVWVE